MSVLNHCQNVHDWVTNVISVIVIIGLPISYFPQHFRIIGTKSSEGLSPLFLLLGSTSAAAGMWNMITVQWNVAGCCSVLSWISCIEVTAGILQVFVQWFSFTLVFVLYIRYYPEGLKHLETPESGLGLGETKTHEWKFSILCAWITFGHFMISAITTLYLMTVVVSTPGPTTSLPHHVQLWATTLGVTSSILAMVQYAPQLVHTYRLKLVGVLSIPMMCITVPGSAFMIAGIAFRPGTNWTSWFTFLVAGVMQGALLLMCTIWKFRQRRLRIDDFGNPLMVAGSRSGNGERTPLIKK